MATVKELRDILEKLPDDLPVWLATFSGNRVSAKPVAVVAPVNLGGFLHLYIAPQPARPLNRPCLLHWLRERPNELPEFAAKVCEFHEANKSVPPSARDGEKVSPAGTSREGGQDEKGKP